MSATAANPSQAHDPSDLYDPDEVVPRNSPLLQPTRLRFQPSPSPPPVFPRHIVSLPSASGKEPNRRMKVQASQGDAVLVSLLDGGRRPEIAEQAGKEPLASASDSDEDEPVSSEADSQPGSAKSRLGDATESEQEIRERTPDAIEGVGEGRGNAVGASQEGGEMGAPAKTSLLQDLAAGALVFVQSEPRHPQESINAGPTPPTTEHDVFTFRERAHSGAIPAAIAVRRDVSYPDQPTPATTSVPSPYTPQSLNPLYSPRESIHSTLAPPKMSPTNGLIPNSIGEGLAPMQLNSPRSETAGATPLPSIRDHFRDLKNLDQQHSPAYTVHSVHSPPANIPRLPSMHGSHGSPPISPNESFHSKLPSPGRLPLAQSPGYHAYYTNGMPLRPLEYGSSSADTSNSDQSATTPGQLGDPRMGFNGLNGPPGGQYVCKYPQCNAPPFQTQYLLNSHANVHSQARPHYCPVKGCPRSEGGKGFKRKNEMIRHGLVHESPGYVCPFCPDREHKYPRPDNLQRHVRVHHIDKDKDDPLLRDVLAQRPDGPNRGRRRRAVNAP